MTAESRRNLAKVRISSGAARLASFSRAGFQFEEEQAGDAERGGDPEMIVENERANEVGGQSGHFCRDTGSLHAREFVPIGEQQKSADYQKPEDHWKKLGSGDQSDGVTDEADKGEGSDSTERVGAGCEFVLFAFEADEEG